MLPAPVSLWWDTELHVQPSVLQTSGRDRSSIVGVTMVSAPQDACWSAGSRPERGRERRLEGKGSKARWGGECRGELERTRGRSSRL